MTSMISFLERFTYIPNTNSALSKYKNEILSLCALIFFIGIQFAHATDYYVSTSGDDGNNGSFSAPWRTINYAVNFQNLKEGDVVYLRGGTYVESVTMFRSGTSNARILVKNYQSEIPIINGDGLAYNYLWTESTGLFNVRGSYITLDGLKVMNANPGPNAGNATGIIVRGPNVTDVTIKNCVTENTRSSGIAIWGQTFDDDYTGCRNIIVENCDISGAVNDGFYEHLTIALGVENYIIRNNKVHDQTAVGREPNLPIGIDSKINVRNGKVYGNEIYNLRKSNGIYVDGWDSEAYNIEIYNNIIHDIDHTGIPIGAEEGGTVHDIKVYNNLIYNTGWNGISLNSANNTIVEGDNNLYAISIYNNTVFNSGQYAMHVFNKNISDIRIANNIFAENRWSNSATLYPENKGAVTMDNNIVFGEQNAFLPGMEVFLGTNAIEENPSFVNKGNQNFRLKDDSPAIDAGTNSLSSVVDLDGKSRSNGTPDIGAYEFGENVTPLDVINAIDAVRSVNSGSSYDIEIAYEAAAERDIIVLFQLQDTPFTEYGYRKTRVTKGKGSVTIRVPIAYETPVAETAYKWSSFIVPIGKNFNDNLAIRDLYDISVEPKFEGIWEIKNKATNSKLAVKSCAKENLENTPLILSGTDSQNCTVFEFVPTEDDYFFIRNQVTKGKYRPKNCDSTANDTVEIVQVGEASFGWCEQWRLIPTTEGYYRIENRQTGQWFRSKGCSGSAGNTITQVSKDFTGNCTQWKLEVPNSNSTGLKANVADEPVISMYPNPTTGTLKLNTSDIPGNVSLISVFDLKGRVVLESTLTVQFALKEMSIDVSGIAKGTYILKLDFTSGRAWSSRFIVE